MEKIAVIISSFNIETELADKTCKLIIFELESEERECELNTHTKSLVRLLCHLSFKQYYSNKFVSKVLDKEVLNTKYGK